MRRLNFSEPVPTVEGSSQKTIVHNCSLFCQTLAAGAAAIIRFQFSLLAALVLGNIRQGEEQKVK